MTKSLIIVDPDIQSGTPVFGGTLVPLQNLFVYLEEGDSLDVFMEQFPSVSRDAAIAVLEQACAALLPDAHPAWCSQTKGKGCYPSNPAFCIKSVRKLSSSA